VDRVNYVQCEDNVLLTSVTEGHAPDHVEQWQGHDAIRGRSGTNQRVDIHSRQDEAYEGFVGSEGSKCSGLD